MSWTRLTSNARRQRITLQMVATAAPVLTILLIAGVVLAQSQISGEGEGRARAGAGLPLVASGAEPTELLYPGGTADVAITINNPNPYAVTVTEINRNGEITSDTTGCDPSNHGVIFTDQTGEWSVPAAGSSTVHLDGAVAMSPDSATECQGATFAVPISLLASGQPPEEDCESPPPAGEEFKWGMLCAHNEVRANAVPVPSPALPQLTWSNDLAEFAQSWANNCTFAHNPDLGPRGENIARGVSTPSQVVGLWAQEAAYYDYPSNSCAPGQTCGHYRLLVSRRTAEIGCAQAACAGRFYVCNYLPAGDLLNRPY